jgi:hypothetical protein
MQSIFGKIVLAKETERADRSSPAHVRLDRQYSPSFKGNMRIGVRTRHTLDLHCCDYVDLAPPRAEFWRLAMRWFGACGGSR